MRRMAFLVAAVVTLPGACFPGGKPGDSAVPTAPADHPFRYEVPSPSEATYQIADTVVMIMSAPDGEMDMVLESSATLELAFAADPGGARVTGTVTDHSAALSSSVLGEMDMGGDSLAGDLEFVIGTTGHVEMESKPEVPASNDRRAMPLQFTASDVFPRFPGHPLGAGDTWADTTVTEDSESEFSAAGLPETGETTMVHTYTLVGDTVIAGRVLHRINLSGAGTTRVVAPEEQAEHTTNNTLEGFFL